MLNFEITDSLNSSDKNIILDGLNEHSKKQGIPREEKEVAVVCRNQDALVVAGVFGEMYWGWLSIKYIWVSDELRGQGIGKDLMLKVEKEAQKQGCAYAKVDTFTFQAPEFYEKLGYQKVAEFPDFPKGETRIYFSKKL